MRFDLSGFNVRLHGLDAACAEVVDEAWGLFAGAGGVPVAFIDFTGSPGPPSR